MANSINILPSALDAARLKEKAATGDHKKVGQDAFLQLMITQLKNQDPSSPMQNGEFLSQMAQFGTVSGITDLQKSFGTLAASLQSSQALQASTMVGRQVLVASDKLALKDGEQPKLGLDLPVATSDVRVTISDAAGQLVRRLDLGAQNAGVAEFAWDGRDDAGNQALAGKYLVKAESIVDGKAQSATTLVRAPVESVTLARGGQPPMLNLADYGAFQIDAIKRVL